MAGNLRVEAQDIRTRVLEGMDTQVEQVEQVVVISQMLVVMVVRLIYDCWARGHVLIWKFQATHRAATHKAATHLEAMEVEEATRFARELVGPRRGFVSFFFLLV